MRDHADLVLRGGPVLTLDDEGAVAGSLAVSGNTIRAVGDVEDLIGPRTTVLELEGRTVIPGINDAHLHLALLGESQPPFAVPLGAVSSLGELRSVVASAAESANGEDWVIGHGWREVNIAEFAAGAKPHRDQIDDVTGRRPTMLQHASAHSVWVNSAVLRLCGITAETPDPPGGRILRDDRGEPTGYLLEAATDLVSDRLPDRSESDRLSAIRSAMRTLNSLGITSVTDPIVWPQLLRDYTRLRRESAMSVRVNMLMHWDWPSPATSLTSLRSALAISGLSAGLGDAWLRLGGCKLFADGVPSHRTAWVYDPYPDGTTGSLVTDGDDDVERVSALHELIETVHRNRLQVQVHVTGDRAAEAVIDGLIRAQELDPWPGARHALIHGTMLAEASLRRLARHDIAVITSSLMRHHSGGSISASIGTERWARAFPAGALLAHGARVADSSDAPVTFPDWRVGIATFCGAPAGALETVPRDLQISRESALRLWTRTPAELEHAEGRKGVLAAGMLADLVVLEGNPLTVPVQELSRVRPVLTIVDGEVVYAAGQYEGLASPRPKGESPAGDRAAR